MAREPKMTVGEMKRMLNQFEDDAELIICPKEWSPEGFPEWHDARVIRDVDGAIVIIEPEDVR